MESLAGKWAIFGLAVLLAAVSGKAVAAGLNRFPTYPSGNSVAAVRPLTSTTAQPADDWGSALPELTDRGPSGSSSGGLAADDKPGTDLADRIVYLASLLAALGGVTAMVASWAFRRRLIRFRHVATWHGEAVPPQRCNHNDSGTVATGLPRPDLDP